MKKIHIFTDNLNKEKLLNFENNKDQLFSIIKNYELSKLLDNNLRKNKYFRKITFNQKKNYFDNFDIVINTDYFSSVTKKYFYKQKLCINSEYFIQNTRYSILICAGIVPIVFRKSNFIIAILILVFLVHENLFILVFDLINNTLIIVEFFYF